MNAVTETVAAEPVSGVEIFVPLSQELCGNIERRNSHPI